VWLKLKIVRIYESTPDSESFVLTESKNNIFTKKGGTKKIHGSNSRGTSRTQWPSTKIFSNPKFLESVKFFGKPASYPFRKVIYVSTNNLKLQSYSINSILSLPIFSKFQLWSQIWQWSSTKFVPKFKSFNVHFMPPWLIRRSTIQLIHNS
jgi:hypothetical protein